MANLRISELDFDQIKTNLKTYLQNQTEFTDYDFEGSGLAVLLDILAYNTHYNAYMANMVTNEMFLDSAVKRESAVSIAKHLGYIPRSTRSARAVVDIEFVNPANSPTSITIDKHTTFSSLIDGVNYTFVNKEAATIRPIGGVYKFYDVELIEGKSLAFNYTVETVGPSVKYEIPNDSVDTSTIEVVVQNSSTDSTSYTYTLTDDVSNIDGLSKVFFLEEGTNGRYQIYFGDNVLGKSLVVGNIVKIRFLTSSGAAANVSGVAVQNFTLSGFVVASDSVVITTTTNSYGGGDKEDITSIKFNAPRLNTALNRAVTKDDYASLIKSNYSMAESVNVWGGEDNVPPIYGKILISLKPYSGYVISNSTKEAIKRDILQSKKVLGITIDFIDPEYYYLGMIINIDYNSNTSSLGAAAIKQNIFSVIQNYFQTDLQQFNKSFNASKLVKNILESDSSIISAIPEFNLQKRITPTLFSTVYYTGDSTIQFSNNLHPNSLKSTKFYIINKNATTAVYLQDVADVSPPDYNGTGTINIVDANTGEIITRGVGITNYATGEVTLSGFIVTGYPSGVSDIRLTAELPTSAYNVTAPRNGIIVADDTAFNPNTLSAAGIDVSLTAVVE